MALCLVVEDEQRQRAVLAGTLRADGHQVLGASTGSEAKELLRSQRPEVVLLDLGLPDTDGLTLIPDFLEIAPLARIVVLTGRDSAKDAVAALRSGARHYLVKPWEREELLLVVAREARAVDLVEWRSREGAEGVFWGTGSAMKSLRQQAEKVARSPHTPVLIEGETGAGKEVLTREIHRLSLSEGNFVAQNCAAIPAELLESELFGHERGAFTGAQARRRGMAELARDGTLMLDEIGEMPASLQAKVLRFLEEHRLRRVGGEEEITVRCRVVAATLRDLESMAARGAFRPDLFFRLAVVRLRIPPLRERREDILPMAYAFLQQLSRGLGRPLKPVSPAAERLLLEHRWPGNARELKNRLERALVLGEETQILPQDLDLPAGEGGAGSAPPKGGGEAQQIRQCLEAEGWNVARAARKLGVERHWLRYRMKKLHLAKPDKN